MHRPSNLERVFMPMLAQMDLMHEWARLVKAKAHPSIFAAFFVELLRDEADSENRQSSMAFLTFIKGRTWPEMTAFFARHAAPADIETLKEPFSEEFFTGFSMMALQSVQEYYEQFLEHRKSVVKQDIKPEDLPKLTDAPDVQGTMDADRAQLIQDVAREVVREIKKMMEDGEDWKKGSSNE